MTILEVIVEVVEIFYNNSCIQDNMWNVEWKITAFWQVF